MSPHIQGSLAAQGKSIHGDQPLQGESTQKGGGQQTDDALAEYHHPFTDQRPPVHDQVDGRFHVGQEYGVLGSYALRQRLKILCVGQEMALVRVEGEYVPVLPGRGDFLACLDDLSNGAIAIFERVVEFSIQGEDAIIDG